MHIYNSLTKQKELFTPIELNKINMYVCGQTVYDYCHLGHARKAVVFDMVRRWFIASGYQVKFVENITDIDDKIIKRAQENNESIYELTNRFIGYMLEDFDKLGVLRADIQPKATDYIPQMLNLIQGLIDKGFAYQAPNGDVYYRVRKFDGYGKLSGKSINDLIAGERVEIDKYKEDPLDFVLWKACKINEPSWPSQFGNGRPGWHIECSAMSEDILGKNFDIHGGGQDLQFPHHENEIAQSEAHNGCTFANYWMHNGFLNINDEKMSKSLGNFFTLRDVLNDYNPEVVRFFILRTHYRSPLNFSHDSLIDAKNSLTKLYQTLRDFDLSSLPKPDLNDKFVQKFYLSMNDDFNTALAISVLFELATLINKDSDIQIMANLVYLAQTIGILISNPSEFLQSGINVEEDYIKEMIDKRNQARKDKDFLLSDKIRDTLLSQGILLEDGKNGTIWRVK